ncbi:iron-containing alcohol dehydrogenase [Devosia sp. SD17-2]|uniref:iron-containing alcohol dehydrogenase n=1 Tax=Devosia sp. SD17-2 TaxID=2976459 RepID=UPI0023D86CBB|nr:iron-containing alcohol dehydrogenase [Devosia sp. SD17-2]WEJ34125.1 iron-containing alcohol dehydrogenase [Devosia sp. SD17-2]
MDVISYLTTVNFGAGAATSLPQIMSELGLSRPLIVSDPGIVAAGLLDRPEFGALSGLPRFLDVPANPTESAVFAGLDAYRGAGCDGVIAIGGGSPIDLAKGIALLATHDGPLEQYAAILGGIARITPNVAPLIAIPTTAGTGSEVGRAALITLDDGRKLGFISGHLIPKRAICDPLLTLGLPAGLTAATALDALSHCIETYLSPRFNPPAEAIARDGFERIWKALPVAVREPTNVAARSDLMMGALEGGMTFQKGLGAVHSLSHALGGLKDLKLHHGLLNAILMPEVIRWNREVPEAAEKLNTLERLAGITEGTLAEELERLNQSLGTSARLSELGVSREIIGWICERALADHSHATNPRPLSATDYAQIIEAVY